MSLYSIFDSFGIRRSFFSLWPYRKDLASQLYERLCRKKELKGPGGDSSSLGRIQDPDEIWTVLARWAKAQNLNYYRTRLSVSY
uniref:Uncharacterized protein n=1 Tax=Psilotum nudum TaxID=3240 RepID=Q8W7M2_PSINU|nr:hypothetical protein PsnuCp068 [Psilotum nudum]NP_569706.1 hypothetical protein PsnuCp101 [Psilotum nudum]BAB84260.1 hypothetical protein [Psilotum nudum]BAB84295.1 hypothetical protein [Psilotum nudum]